MNRIRVIILIFPERAGEKIVRRIETMNATKKESENADVESDAAAEADTSSKIPTPKCSGMSDEQHLAMFLGNDEDLESESQDEMSKTEEGEAREDRVPLTTDEAAGEVLAKETTEEEQKVCSRARPRSVGYF
jgi:hypothetical protein